jgi:prepilin-type N-terminal cleavage/methylation domain-containing protein
MIMHTQPRPSRAFTLAEILVVVVILGIASAIVVPQIGNRDDLKAASATRVLMADLMYAQNLSIATQTKHYVRFDTAGTPQTVAIYDNAALATPITHPVQKDPYVRDFRGTGALDIPDVGIDSVTIQAGTKTGNAIGFTSLGEPQLLDSLGVASDIDTAATITVIAGTYKQSIVLQPLTGEISVTTP